MQRDENLYSKVPMFRLQGRRVTSDDSSQYFEQFSETIVLLFFVSYQKNEVHDLGANVRALNHILAIDSVQNSLEIVTLSRIFAVKQVKELDDEILRNVLRYH